MSLYIVSTPIGNLKDITIRAIEVLKEVDLILAEDTRRTGKLLKEYNISNKMLSYNDYNKSKRTKEVISLLKENKNVAVVSDAGTPSISDPGFYIVRECIKENIKVIPIPGASALLAGLVGAGLPTDKFEFYGFLPKGPTQKERIFSAIDKTTVFYESPHRIIKTLKVMNEVIHDKEIVIARELTKKFEEFIRGTVKDVYNSLKDKVLKGEIVLIVK